MAGLLPTSINRRPGRAGRRPARGCGQGCAFTISPLPFGGSCNFAFRNETPGGVGWLWDFGDGNTSDLENPNHQYVDAGLYTVTLRVFLSTGDFTGDGLVNSADFLAWQRGETTNPGSSEDLQIILDNFGGAAGPAFRECSQEVECDPPVINSCVNLEAFLISHRKVRFDLISHGSSSFPATYCPDCNGIDGMNDVTEDPFRPPAPVAGITWIMPVRENQTTWLICENTHMNFNATVNYSCNINQITGQWNMNIQASYDLTAGTQNNPPRSTCPGDRKKFGQTFILPGGQFPVAQSWVRQRFEVGETADSPEDCCGEGDISIGVQLIP